MRGPRRIPFGAVNLPIQRKNNTDVTKCGNGVNENEYLPDIIDVFDRFRISLSEIHSYD